MNKSGNLEHIRNRAKKVMVGGVSAEWNYHGDGTLYFESADGMRLTDIEGHEYIDYMAGHSSIMLGHSHPVIEEAISRAAKKGFGCQCETESHIELAEIICDVVPCAEKVRLSNTGTEATLNAIRLARCYTGRDLIVKFEGNFHGLHDYVLFSTDLSPEIGERHDDGSIEPIHGSGGVPDRIDQLTITLPYNDVSAFERVMELRGKDVAAVILEPIAFNMGYVPAEMPFLNALRVLTEEHQSVLIFDEVITGFRVALGGAQELLSITPDLACFGKALGGGAPIAAVVGRQHIMDHLTPLGDATMSGTNTGRWLTVEVTLAVLKEYCKDGFYGKLSQNQSTLINGMREIVKTHDVPAFIGGEGGCIGVYFGLTSQPRNLREIYSQWNEDYTRKISGDMLNDFRVFGFARAVSRHPERISVSWAHSAHDIEFTLDSFEKVVRRHPYT